MKMSIARALKERKRLIGEMNTTWNRIVSENVVTMTIRADKDNTYKIPSDEEIASKRKLSPTGLMNEWEKLHYKLMAIKSKIHAANAGIVDKLIGLSEAKAELQLVEAMPGYSNEISDYGESTQRLVNVVFDTKWKMDRIDLLHKAINNLQDEIDEYNATHFIEVED